MTDQPPKPDRPRTECDRLGHKFVTVVDGLPRYHMQCQRPGCRMLRAKIERGRR